MAEILALLPKLEQLRQLAQYTANKGHSLVGANSLKRARDLAAERRPNVLVAPIDFEYGEVLAFMRWAKSEPDLKHMQFLLFAETNRSAVDGDAERLKLAARALGVDRFVCMPHFEASELWWQIAVVLPEA